MSPFEFICPWAYFCFDWLSQEPHLELKACKKSEKLIFEKIQSSSRSAILNLGCLLKSHKRLCKTTNAQTPPSLQSSVKLDCDETQILVF